MTRTSTVFSAVLLMTVQGCLLVGAENYGLRSLNGEFPGLGQVAPPSATARTTWNGSLRTVKTVSAEGLTTERIPLPEGYRNGIAIDINNRGVVAGMVFAADGRDQTFVWKKGEAASTLIRHPEAGITAVASIADSGWLFGNWGSLLRQTAGFHHPASGSWKPLPEFPGKNLNFGQRANNAGFANGVACNGTWFQPEDCVIWLWNGNEYSEPKLPESLYVVIDGVNEIGQIAGRYMIDPPFNFRSFMLDGTSATVLMPDTKSSAFDINNKGDVVLNFESAPGTLFVPAVFSKEQLKLLPLMEGALGTTFQGLNDRGDFAGFAYDPSAASIRDSYPVVALATP